MLLALFLTTSPATLGIGLYGNVPGGWGFSLRYFSAPNTVLQLVIGGFAVGEHRSVVVIGGRIPFGVGGTGNGYRLMHFFGPGLWLAIVGTRGGGSGIGVTLTGFYELEVWPNPSALPFSFTIGAGLALNFTPFDLGFFIPISFHFYFK